MTVRCGWATTDPLYIAYHDDEWGVPVHDDRQLFEMLILEGAQAGLSWLQVLQRRDAYRQAFLDFDPSKVAQLDPERLLVNPGLIRIASSSNQP
jgi:DNA-3-methyladenine glycosylase I